MDQREHGAAIKGHLKGRPFFLRQLTKPFQGIGNSRL
jgi:hypothetical protein